jgi:hypothetical protein
LETLDLQQRRLADNPLDAARCCSPSVILTSAEALAFLPALGLCCLGEGGRVDALCGLEQLGGDFLAGNVASLCADLLDVPMLPAAEPARDPSTRSTVSALFGAAWAYPRIIVAEGKDVHAIAHQAVAANERTIVAGGGDGTVSTIGAELAGTGITMGVLPLGTLNHFARDLRIPLHLEGAVRTVLDHHVAAVDVGEVNDRIFVNNSRLGIYPHVVALRQAEQHWLKRGKFQAQVSAIIHVLRRFRFLDLRITVDGKQLLRRTPIYFHR